MFVAKIRHNIIMIIIIIMIMIATTITKII